MARPAGVGSRGTLTTRGSRRVGSGGVGNLAGSSRVGSTGGFRTPAGGFGPGQDVLGVSRVGSDPVGPEGFSSIDAHGAATIEHFCWAIFFSF